MLSVIFNYFSFSFVLTFHSALSLFFNLLSHCKSYQNEILADIRSCGMLRRVYLQLASDVLEKPIGFIFKGRAVNLL